MNNCVEACASLLLRFATSKGISKLHILGYSKVLNKCTISKISLVPLLDINSPECVRWYVDGI